MIFHNKSGGTEGPATHIAVDLETGQAVYTEAFDASKIPFELQPLIDSQTAVDIYSAAIRQVYTVDNGLGGYHEFPTVYLVAATDDRAGSHRIEDSPTVVLDEVVRKGIKANLEDFTAEFVWVEESADVSWEDGRVQGGGAIIEMGNIYLREDGTAQVAISITYGNLGSSGLTYVLEDIEGRWQIVGNTGTRWMA